MFMRMIYDDALAQAAYLIGCQRTGEAIVFDPERDIDRYTALAKTNNLRIVAAAETHIHADFLSGVRELAEQVGARVYVSGEGGPDWDSRWLQQKRGGGSYNAVELKDGDTFRIGNIEFQALHTPGHTPEHISYLVTDLGAGADEPMGMITGDFVFVGDLGRPDLLETAAGMEGMKEDSAIQLFGSAKRFVTDIPAHVQVWPAHGAGSACGKALGAVPQSTAGYEKKFSPALRLVASESEFTGFILEGQPEPPVYFARMKQQNRDGVPLLGKLPTPTKLDESNLSAIPRTAVVVDTRPVDRFKKGHLAGSIYSPLGGMFHTAAGSYVDPGSDIVLIVEETRLEQALRECVRIGLDRVVSYITPDTLDRYAASGAELASLRDVSPSQLSEALQKDHPLILDVRKATEHAERAIPGAMNKAHTRLAESVDDLPRDRDIYVHCKAGVRSVVASSLMLRQGLRPINVAGGFDAWAAAGFETTK